MEGRVWLRIAVVVVALAVVTPTTALSKHTKHVHKKAEPAVGLPAPLADGPITAQTKVLLETDAKTDTTSKVKSKGFASFLFRRRKKKPKKNTSKKLQGRWKKSTSGAAQRFTKDDQQCAICIFVVERIKGEMLMNGIGVGMPPHRLMGVPFGENKKVEPVGKGPARSGPNAPPQLAGSRAGVAANGQKTGVPTFLETMAKKSNRKNSHHRTSAAPSLLQVDSTDSFVFKSLKKGFKKLTGKLKWLAGSRVHKGLPFPGRGKAVSLRYFKPLSLRYMNMYDGPLRSAQRAQERFENDELFSTVYRVIEPICSQESPREFFGFCGHVLAKFRKIAEGLRFGDRPDLICMHQKLCSKYSYVFNGPHGKRDTKATKKKKRRW